MKRILLTLAAASLFSPAAMAFNATGSFPLTFGGGYYYLASKRHIDNTGAISGSLGYNITDQWGVLGLLAGFNSNSNRTVDRDNRTVNGTLFAFNIVYHFQPQNNFQPYLAAGPGVLGLSPNGDDARNEGNINAAGGAQYFIGKKMALGLEGRGIYTIIGGKLDGFVDAGITYMFNV